MDETTTRIRKIDPQLREVGWDVVPESTILYEQRAYLIAPGRVDRLKSSNPKKADYILQYHGQKLAVIEAKKDTLDVSEGVPQAKLYAEMLQIRYAYSCNGNEIWFIDMGVKDKEGKYIVPSSEHEVDKFPSPDELWKMTFPDENLWRDKFNLCPIYRDDSGKTPRYYQENAINRVLGAVAEGQKRILLTMATGTGKTYTAFQICWKLYQTRWNRDDSDRAPNILFIADLNLLANQATNDFGAFKEEILCRITPELLHKRGGKVPTGWNIYFTIFQTMMTEPPAYMRYPKDFFDFIIIDECHRGGANDESEWRKLMDYFTSAYQLGLTATPKRRDNANTYAYFGKPVYSYSLKQGISDGYLTPFRVRIATSNIDDYKYEEDDDVEGDIDKDKTYTEDDFYHGRIEMRDRDEHRVMQLLEQIDSDEKTLIFCCNQRHAAIVRDLINKHKRCPDNNYCERVTCDDGEAGERILRQFQNNERLRPTILTTSKKLSTGVDARNVRNIVLMRPIKNMVEFKQIIGRGTRLFDEKYYFTIYDFVGASDRFQDEDWDGDPFCPVCGNYPCTCKKYKDRDEDEENDDHTEEEAKPVPKPCPVCGNLPCTCEETEVKGVKVKLSKERKARIVTFWDTRIQFDDELITMEEFMRRLFGRLPQFFKGELDLYRQWENPDKRKQLLLLLEESGFATEKLEMLQSLLEMEQCDLLDVLLYVAYNTSPVERAQRVAYVRGQYLTRLTEERRKFSERILQYYLVNGMNQLGSENLGTFISMQYNSIQDANEKLGLDTAGIRTFYWDLQKQIYSPKAQKTEIHLHFEPGTTYIEKQVTINKDRNKDI